MAAVKIFTRIVLPLSVLHYIQYSSAFEDALTKKKISDFAEADLSGLDTDSGIIMDILKKEPEHSVPNSGYDTERRSGGVYGLDGGRKSGGRGGGRRGSAFSRGKRSLSPVLTDLSDGSTGISQLRGNEVHLRDKHPQERITSRVGGVIGLGEVMMRGGGRRGGAGRIGGRRGGGGGRRGRGGRRNGRRGKRSIRIVSRRRHGGTYGLGKIRRRCFPFGRRRRCQG